MVVAVGRLMQGAARAMLEPRDEFVAEIREALAAYRATGARFQSTYHLILLAQALAACGRYGEGLSALHEAAALVEETGERYVEAEIHRLEGNLLLAENGAAEAEACYAEGARGGAGAAGAARSNCAPPAISPACGPGAASPRGRRDLLAPVYGWFTEGFDTPTSKRPRRCSMN